MARPPRPLATFGLLTLLEAASFGASGVQGGGVSITLAPDKPSFTLKEPVTVRLVIRNNSDDSLRFDLGLNDRTNLQWACTMAGENKTKQLEPQLTGFGWPGRHQLAPSREFSVHLIMDEWIEFDVPGDYEVDVTLTSPPKFDEGGLVAETGTHATIRVLPRDLDSLRRRCQALSRDAVSHDSARAHFAARALSFVSDPEVVPYLKKVLDDSFFGRETAIEGLGKLGTSEAVDSLIAAFGGRDPEIAALARYQLSQVARTTENEELRERITKILSKQN